MPLRADFCKHTLNFRFEAGTSRGVLTSRDSWIIRLYQHTPDVAGLGEAAPLKGLSLDDRPDFEEHLQLFIQKINREDFELNTLTELARQYFLPAYPSLYFAFETARIDLINGGKRLLFSSPFSEDEKPIPINGLIWMGNEQFMTSQIETKLQEGFKTLKMKIGAIDFDTEMKLLQGIRKRFTASQLCLRVDANGAFSPHEAAEVLHELRKLEIHSIEQPIKAGNWEEMARLCRNAATAIALDEELIGIYDTTRHALLNLIKPQFLIFKPTLLGGFAETDQWIELCRKMSIGWWITSALESNIGLNAICQYTAAQKADIPQGLGTGQLYHNNIHSPLEVSQGSIFYHKDQNWDLSGLQFTSLSN